MTLPEVNGRVVVHFDRYGRKLLDVSLARVTLVKQYPCTVEGSAAQIASHLRRVAVMLHERGRDAPPMPAQIHLGILLNNHFPDTFRRRVFIEWLRLILIRRANAADDISNSLRGALECLESDERDKLDYSEAGAVAHDRGSKILLPRRRISHHASRWNVTDVDSVVAVLAGRYQWNFAIYDAALYWTALTHDLRFMLTFERAERIEMLASVMENAAGLPPCPPRRGPRRGGQWRHVAYNLVMKLDVSAAYLNERARATGTSVMIDFLAVRIEPATFAEPRMLNLVEQCRQMLLRACDKRRQKLRIARIELQPQANVPARYVVYLETWEQGVCVESVMECCGALKYACLKTD